MPTPDEPDRTDPAYHEGFYDAQAGEPLFDDAHPLYRAGWQGFWTCHEIAARWAAN